MKNEYPDTLGDLISKVKEIEEIRNPTQYSLYAVKNNLPAMPHLTYAQEKKSRDDIWKLMFPYIKKDNTSRPFTGVNTQVHEPSKQKNQHEDSVPKKPVTIATQKTGDLGYLTQYWLVTKIRNEKFTKNRLTYLKFAPMFSDWPNNPEQYYEYWIGWDSFFNSPIKELKRLLLNGELVD